MRYEDVFLLEALMLKMKSNATFKHFRNNKILPLPSPSTIGNLTSSSNCHFGFNEFALENIENALKEFGKDDPTRYGCLMWDAVHLVKSVKLNARQRIWDGIMNYDSDFSDLEANSLANHALVLVVGAAPACMINRIVLKAITSFYTRGPIVKNVACDGHQTNKEAMKKLQVTAKDQSKVKPYFLHPMDPEIKIWGFFDVPHLLKFVRNNLLTHNRCQVLSE